MLYTLISLVFYRCRIIHLPLFIKRTFCFVKTRISRGTLRLQNQLFRIFLKFSKGKWVIKKISSSRRLLRHVAAEYVVDSSDIPYNWRLCRSVSKSASFEIILEKLQFCFIHREHLLTTSDCVFVDDNEYFRWSKRNIVMRIKQFILTRNRVKKLNNNRIDYFN